MTILFFERRDFGKAIFPTTALTLFPRKTEIIKQARLSIWNHPCLAPLTLCRDPTGKFGILHPTGWNVGVAVLGVILLELLIHFLPFQIILAVRRPIEADRIQFGVLFCLKFPGRVATALGGY